MSGEFGAMAATRVPAKLCLSFPTFVTEALEKDFVS